MLEADLTLRQKKVAQLLEKTFNEYFRKKTADYGAMILTVTRVIPAKDLKMAQLYISIFQLENQNKKTIFESIVADQKIIRKDIGIKLGKQLQFIPEFYFKLDEGLENIQEVNRLLGL